MRLLRGGESDGGPRGKGATMADKNATPTARHAAYLGLDVSKESHWAYALDSEGTVLLSRRVANSETELAAVVAKCPQDALAVADQRRNIGALAIGRPTRARAREELPRDREDRRARRPGHSTLGARHAAGAAAGAGRRPQDRRGQDSGGPALAGPEGPHGVRQRAALPPARIPPGLRSHMPHDRAVARGHARRTRRTLEHARRGAQGVLRRFPQTRGDPLVGQAR